MYTFILLFVTILTSLFLSHKYFISVRENSNNKYFVKNVLNKKYLVSLAIFILLTFLLYLNLGRPDLLQPQSTQKELEFLYTKAEKPISNPSKNEELFLLYRKLKETIENRPADLTGHNLLVKTCLTLNRYSEARLAQERVLSLKGSRASMRDYSFLLDIYLVAAGGSFSIEASKILKKMKENYPESVDIYFFMALEHIERKNYFAAIEIWKKLKSQSGLNTERLKLLENKLKRVGYSDKEENSDDQG